MKKLNTIPAILITCFTISCNPSLKNNNMSYQWPKAVQPPVAKIKAHQRIIHGDTVSDNYYWMIDYFKKGPDSDTVLEYLKEENAYLDTMMSGTKLFQQQLFEEMKGRIKEKDESVPVFKNGYYYYTRTEDGQQYFKYCRRKGSLDAPEEILLDVDQLALGHPYYSASNFTVSEDNRLLAFAADTLSRRQYDIYVKNIETGEILHEGIGGTTGEAVWAADNETLFYTQNNPETLLSEKIKRHKLFTKASEDVVVYEEKDPSNYIEVKKSKSGRYIYIISKATLSSEVRFISANSPNDAFQIFQPRMKEVLYSVDDLGDRFYILTNLEAKNFRLMECPLNNTESGNWKEVIPHRKDVLLEKLDVFKNFYVVTERKKGLIQLHIHQVDTGEEHFIDFEEPAYRVYSGPNPEYNSNKLRYNYTSLITPASVYDYDMYTRKKELKKQQEVVGGYNPDNYVTERLYATAKDGTSVPVSIVYKKGFEKNGMAPLLLYGYGAYGIVIDAAFNSSRLSLLDRGFAFAIAHIRGGEDLGREWYENGKMMKKKNTFTDFIDCADFLMKEKYTSKQHLYAQGGSAGGLLIGAVVNIAPDIWNGVIAEVPFVDVVNTMLDESIPLTTNEYDEWGNPNREEAYNYMKSYSPYENVEKKNYPNMMVTTGLHDSQVQYFEPAKWVAKLRAIKTSDNILLFHTNMDYGHGGASGRFDYLKDIALEYAFLFSLEGIDK